MTARGIRASAGSGSVLSVLLHRHFGVKGFNFVFLFLRLQNYKKNLNLQTKLLNFLNRNSRNQRVKTNAIVPFTFIFNSLTLLTLQPLRPPEHEHVRVVMIFQIVYTRLLVVAEIANAKPPIGFAFRQGDVES